MNRTGSSKQRDLLEVVVLEWRYSGHRLAYVAALARSAQVEGCSLLLYTDDACVASDEYQRHLKQFEGSVLRLRVVRSLQTGPKQARAMIEARSLSAHLIVPEADRLLPIVTLLSRLSLLPVMTSLILMRPPNTSSFSSQLKRFLVKSTSRASRLRLLLLEDPLGSPQVPVWPEELLRHGSVIYDPSDLIPIGEGTVPPELKDIGSSTTLAVVVGGITPRKHVREILAAWPRVGEAMRPQPSPVLVLAGRHARVAQTSQGEDIVHINRYLDDRELSAVFNRASAVLSLQTEPLSSGTILAAAARGIPVVTMANTRLGLIVQSERLGTVAESLSVDHLCEAIVEAFNMRGERRVLPTCRDFARTLFGSLRV